jgi:hypothetical protein
MAAEDVTRLLDPAVHHYVGARAQQGRPLVDSDFNEGRRADDQEWRAAARDIVGSKASPDAGFLPDLEVGAIVNSQLVRFGAFVRAFVLNYNLRPGTIHVGGWRFEQEEAQPVIFQREYLQMGPATAPRAVLGMQRQLSYLRGWEHPVTAIEDGELVEPALHGADAATRVRRTRRVEVRSVEAGDCADAFDEVLQELGDGTSATYNPQTCELKSNARLQMGFYGDAGGACAGCDPALKGKYLGNEDHCIRVMLASATSYVWAFDNAAPLYRAKLVFDATGAHVEMLTPPKDTYHEPGLNRVVEFLPWSVLLENGKPLSASPNAQNKATGEKIVNEKLAARAGFFAEVDAPYDPGTRSFHARIDPANLAAVGAAPSKAQSKSLTTAQIRLKTGESQTADIVALEWDPAHPHASELNPSDPESGDLVGFVYLRIWHEKNADDPLTIPTTSTKPLGRTGLVLMFSGTGRRGDFWRATVRTEARDEILPRAIMRPGGVPPDGPIEVVAPLALLEWNSTFGVAHELVNIRDCRPNLPAITNRACCTHVVGPGTSGGFLSIQAALDALPPAGGRICVLPGTYREAVRVARGGRIRITGCGAHTVVESPEGAGSALIDLAVTSGDAHIELDAFAVRASGQIGILAHGANIDLANLDVEVQPNAAGETSSALRLLEAERVRVTDCRLRVNGGFSHDAAVYVDALSDTLLEGNRIETTGGEAWGGVQVRGGSRRVELRNNDVIGGRGHGITIGSARFRAVDGSDLGLVGAGLGQSDAQPPFLLSGRLEPVDITDADNGTLRYYPESDPPIEDLLIVGNRIRDCFGSGIAALAPEVEHEDAAVVAPLCLRRTTFAVAGLKIDDNLIQGNALGPPGALGADRTRGGIILSEATGLDVTRNRIHANGPDVDAGPICGIYLARGSQVVIADNRLARNGQLPDRDGISELRGGIVLRRPRPLDLLEALAEDASVSDILLRSNVVESDSGAALVTVCDGRCSIVTNHLQSRPPALPGSQSWGTVVVAQPGRPCEGIDLPAEEPSRDRWVQPAGSFEYLTGRAQTFAGSGGLLFADNQVLTVAPPRADRAGAVPALLLSTDSVILTSNQFTARMPRNSLITQAWVVGATVTVADNRIADGIETTPVSLIAMAPMLTLAAGNILTHCPVVFGCDNHGDDAYYVDEDNLTWFRLQQRRCDQETERLAPALQSLCNRLFGFGEPSGDAFGDRFNSFVAFRRSEP